MTAHRWTLVLNKHWTPITVTSVFRAIRTVCRGSATVLDPESYEQFDLNSWINRSTQLGEVLPRNQIITLTTGVIEKPEIILLTSYTGVPYVEVNFNRKNLYKRDKYHCQYCNKRFSMDDLSIDHVVPRAAGGQTTWGNCVTACKLCNHKKADRPLEETRMALIRQPAAPKWSPIVSFLPIDYPPSWDKFINHK